MNKERYNKIMSSSRGIETIYNILYKYIIRTPSSIPYNNMIFENYYKKGELASVANIETLSNITGSSKSLVKKNIKFLVSVGLIKPLKDDIYLLGRWEETDCGVIDYYIFTWED